MRFPSSWSPSEKETAEAYFDTLSDLKMNSKPIINTLTELANGYSKEHPHVIVHVIEERIREVTPDLKLTVLYLMDSIVKNHSDPYKRLFGVNVAATFCHVFKHSNEKGRTSLFKLRGTWNDVFSPAALLDLDKSTNKMDPAWPIFKPKVSATNIHINPAVFGRSANTAATSKPAPMSEVDRLQAEVKRKELELMELKKKQLDIELEKMKQSLREEEMKSAQLSTDPPATKEAPLVVQQVLSQPHHRCWPIRAR